MFGDHLFRDESFSSLPLLILRGVVQDVVDRESFGVGRGEGIEFGFEENVGRVDVGVDQTNLGRVEGVLHRCSNDLL